MKRIIFIETSDIGARYTAEGCRRLGYHPLILADLNNVQGDTLSQLKEEQALGNVLDTVTTSVAQIFTALQRAGISREDIAGVMTFLDSRLEIAIALNEKLNTKFKLDPAILKLKSKTNVQQLIPEWSPASLTFSSKNLPLEKMSEFIERFGKIILKPSKTAGAIGAKIFDINNRSEIEAHIQSEMLPSHLDDEQWICQAFLAGAIFSIEGYVRNGDISILGLSDRKKVGFTESQIEFPISENTFSSEAVENYKTAVALLVKRSGFINGFFHIEFILMGDQIFIIDANMGRLGGGPLGEMIAMSYGVQIEDFYAFVIERSLMPDNNPEYSVNFETAPELTRGICYGLPQKGTLNSVTIASHTYFKHTLILNPNQVVDAMGANNWTWVGIVAGKKFFFENHMRTIELKVDGQRMMPCY